MYTVANNITSSNINMIFSILNKVYNVVEFTNFITNIDTLYILNKINDNLNIEDYNNGISIIGNVIVS